MVSVLLKAKANTEATNNQGMTPLHTAAGLGRADICQLLLDAGAKVSVRSNSGFTPAEMARSGAVRKSGEDRLRFEQVLNVLDPHCSDSAEDKFEDLASRSMRTDSPGSI